MLLFVSDLHLEDSPRQFTIPLERFVCTLNLACRRARRAGVAEITLVLLGDIFELLKSSRWWKEPSLRPWQRGQPEAIRQRCAEIFQGVVDVNSRFFEGLRTLVAKHGVRLLYLVGNHDLLMGVKAGEDARQILREQLPGLAIHDSTILLDPLHEVVAKHGQEWDPVNRTQDPETRSPDWRCDRHRVRRRPSEAGSGESERAGSEGA